MDLPHPKNPGVALGITCPQCPSPFSRGRRAAAVDSPHDGAADVKRMLELLVSNKVIPARAAAAGRAPLDLASGWQGRGRGDV